jgi:hypothetical protein
MLLFFMFHRGDAAIDLGPRIALSQICSDTLLMMIAA